MLGLPNEVRPFEFIMALVFGKDLVNTLLKFPSQELYDAFRPNDFRMACDFGKNILEGGTP